jgi:hypothetical protein
MRHSANGLAQIRSIGESNTISEKAGKKQNEFGPMIVTDLQNDTFSIGRPHNDPVHLRTTDTFK